MYHSMKAPRRRIHVFLAHAHGDKKSVRDLYNRMTGEGVKVWLDEERLLPGQDWEHEIRKAIRKSDAVVICLSNRFNSQRGYRQKELRIALEEAELLPEGRIFIIPARLEDCEIPESLWRWQRVDLFEANGYKKLMRALRRQAAPRKK
jgi:hypothetical protein